MQRAAGILLHPTSLPGPYGIGDFGASADRFLEWCASAGQSVWQILPLGPTGYGNSPYGSLSAFAKNPLLVSPDQLVHDGLLSSHDLRSCATPPGEVDFQRVERIKGAILRAAWDRFTNAPAELRESFAVFRDAEASWLEDWCLFRALKDENEGRVWREWSEPLARRDLAALGNARERLRAELEFHAFVQFVLRRQWQRVREVARAHGVSIVGDIPIYVAYDSADVWANQTLFNLGEDLRPSVVAGVPPDYFSATGQLWGNPLFRWDVHEAEGYDWWIRRVESNLRDADLVRLDHFRGFAAYWEVPGEETTAINGRWVDGPGGRLFAAIEKRIGSLPFVAEDLGLITGDVDELRDGLRLPGMKVLQFGFGDDDNIHLPHRHTVATVVYTATHDNATTREWYEGLSKVERARVRDYAGPSDEPIEWQFIRIAYRSVAVLAIIPMQDVIGLGGEGRMNRPGVADGNWAWRARDDDFRSEDAARLRRMAVLCGRYVEKQ